MLPQKFLASLFAGRAIPVISAASFGRLMTSIDLAIDTRARDVVAAVAENRNGSGLPISGPEAASCRQAACD